MAANVFGITDPNAAIQEILEDLYEVEVSEQGSSLGSVGEVVVSTVSTIIRTANANRKAVTIKNIGSVIAYITTGSIATLQGFPVEPNGVLEFEGYFGDITGIAVSSGTAIRYVEII